MPAHMSSGEMQRLGGLSFYGLVMHDLVMHGLVMHGLVM